MNHVESEIVKSLIHELIDQGLELVLFPQNSHPTDNLEDLLKDLEGSHETELHVYERRRDRTYKHCGFIGLRWGGFDVNTIRQVTPRLLPHIKQTQEVVARLRNSAVGK